VLEFAVNIGRVWLAATAIALTGCSQDRSGFRGDIRPLLDLEPTGNAEASIPYRTGKVLIVDRKSRTVDETQRWIPNEMRALRPEEVQTLIAVDKCYYTEVGRYERLTRRPNPAAGPIAFEHSCDLTLIDLPSRTLIGSSTLTEPPPIIIRPPFPSGVAPRPEEKIVKFVISLPVREPKPAQ
jgi:hypothetical protein